ncbi:hypothetical protein [Maliponia aquimaris]|uniref:hypothetical protein n=1 Tax=Maliponia aquimaris TaxID=1673631 RepID=UPI000B8A6921|nr:hypothetical protein [Maliponia aquimaris]
MIAFSDYFLTHPEKRLRPDLIADPDSTHEDVAHALWTRARERRGGPTDDAAGAEAVADVFPGCGGYRDPIDGRQGNTKKEAGSGDPASGHRA